MPIIKIVLSLAINKLNVSRLEGLDNHFGEAILRFHLSIKIVIKNQPCYIAIPEF